MGRLLYPFVLCLPLKRRALKNIDFQRQSTNIVRMHAAVWYAQKLLPPSLLLR